MAARRPGHGLPQAFYNDEVIYAFDLEPIFFSNWLMFGFECELPRQGNCKSASEDIDSNVENLIFAWHVTNLQDRDLAKNNQRGVNGKGYCSGPYLPIAEALVMRFADWYQDQVIAAGNCLASMGEPT